MLQAVKIVREAKQQSLAALCQQTAAGRTAGEFSLGRGENSFDQGPPAIEVRGEMVSHLGAQTMNAPSFLAASTSVQAPLN